MQFRTTGSHHSPKRPLSLLSGATHLGMGYVAAIVDAASTRRADWRGRIPFERCLIEYTVRLLLLSTGQASFRSWDEEKWILDGQLVLASMVSGQWTRYSNRNLIQNIGFDELATHTFEDRGELQPVMPTATPTAPVLVLSTRADDWTRKHHFHYTWEFATSLPVR